MRKLFCFAQFKRSCSLTWFNLTGRLAVMYVPFSACRPEKISDSKKLRPTCCFEHPKCLFMLVAKSFSSSLHQTLPNAHALSHVPFTRHQTLTKRCQSRISFFFFPNEQNSNSVLDVNRFLLFRVSYKNFLLTLSFRSTYLVVISFFFGAGI